MNRNRFPLEVVSSLPLSFSQGRDQIPFFLSFSRACGGDDDIYPANNEAKGGLQ